MTKVQIILKEIESLDVEEQDEVLQFLLKKNNQNEKVKGLLKKYKGRGQNVWQEDAQSYVNQLREDDRC